MLFSDPTGSGIEAAPQVLVQGTADVDDRDLDANRERYKREMRREAPGGRGPDAAEGLRAASSTGTSRASTSTCAPSASTSGATGTSAREPQLFDAHMEEVRSGHAEEPASAHAAAGGRRRPAWDERMDELGSATRTAVISLVAPGRLPVLGPRCRSRSTAPRGGCGWRRRPVGVPWQPGPAPASPPTTTSRELQLAAQLPGARRPRRGGRRLGDVPRKLMGGFELPPARDARRARLNMKKMRRFRKIAKRELAARGR